MQDDYLPGPEDMPATVIAQPVVYRILAHAETSPDALALVATASAGVEVSRSYGALRADILRFADGLRRRGVAQGDRIGIFADNENACQAIVAILAANLLGAVFVPLNARYTARELLDAARRAACSVILAADRLAPTVNRIRGDLPALREIILMENGNGAADFKSILDLGAPDAQGWPQLAPDDISEIMFTSGTTAAPKAAIVTHGRTAAAAHIYRTMLDLRPDDRLQSFFPIFTTASTKCVILPILSAGGAAIIDAGMSIPDSLARMKTYGSTIYYGVPAFYIFLLEHMRIQPERPSALRLFIYGGAAMPLTPIRQLAEFFPEVGLAQTFGSTETGATGTILYPRYTLSRMGSVGRAGPYTAVKLVADDGTEVADGVQGEFAVRSAAVFAGYLDDPATSRATLKDGWVLMGDIGYRDADGFFYHTDRKKDIIIRGGHNIGSMEVEDVIYKFPDIEEAAAIAVPHPKLGEDVFVFVVMKEGRTLDASALLTYCRDMLADYKVPRHIVAIPSMPRNPMGKILKTELRVTARELLGLE
ncbi:long-chain-fatty-acid--CoA ligase [Tistrella bauzanensis]|uniref:Long-chain-fatty-acid--CoA ligase n=1 Tax=Tistrella bauzanensis TaxID=657419 RepID=A0ABQ1IAF5_9PROT|nr:class I adenylate-forming enzyme family protein [Tistrella bauzanensis]GGB28310.1 long-chain-fatty-acid--CoA ligase [Tistrella bauzanensis]